MFLLHFSRKKGDSNPSTTPKVTTSNMTMAEDPTTPYLRWLGVFFDKKLSYKWHVRIRAEKAMKVAKALCSLGNTQR